MNLIIIITEGKVADTRPGDAASLQLSDLQRLQYAEKSIKNAISDLINRQKTIANANQLDIHTEASRNEQDS